MYPASEARPNTIDPSPLSKDVQNDLFDAYLTTNETSASIATRLNIPLQDFIAWHDHPNTQQILTELDRIAQERAEHQRKQSAPSATQALIEILDSRHLIKNPEPARKAANKLLAGTRATDLPPRQVGAPAGCPIAPDPCHDGPSSARRASVRERTPVCTTLGSEAEHRGTDPHRNIERPEGPKEPSRGRKPTESAEENRKPQRGDTPEPPNITPPNHGDTKTEHRGTDPRRNSERPEGPNEPSRGRKPTEKSACIEKPQRGDTHSALIPPPTNQRAPNPEHRVAPVIPSPMPHPRSLFRTAALALSMVLPLTTSGCKPSKPPEAATTIVKHTYTVRGEVQQLPDPADARKEFVVRHEEIPEFKGPQGQVGMKAMVMPFPLGEGFKTEGLSMGQKITLTFTVEFDTATDRPKRYYADSWVGLDALTVLDFSDRSKGK